MSFISYAQNFEDVMLWRALKHIENGFYIDIGANDPEIYSVTKSMYDLGWSGINCEPVLHWFEKLEKERPNDINIQVAIGEKNTELTFYEVVNTGLSTLDKKTAEEHAQKLGFEIKEYLVPIKTLTSICNEKNIDTIHFLKIDVEGAEKSVLEGIDFSKIRPWIIVIEATKPMSEHLNFEKWETLILSQEYHFVYFDGLNRFYISNTHSDLDKAFNTPPNVFDGFTLVLEHTLLEETTKLKKELTEFKIKANKLESKIHTLKAKIHTLKVKIQNLKYHNNLMQNSSSWKLTKPYRFAGDKIKWLKGNSKAWITFAPTSRPRKILKQRLINLKSYLNKNPELKRKMLNILEHMPSIKRRLQRVGGVYPDPTTINNVLKSESDLSPNAKKIHQQLITNIKHNKGTNN